MNPPECSDALCLVQALLNRRPEIYITSNVDLEGVGILPTIENRVSITGVCDKSKCRLDAKGSSGMFVVGLSGYLTLKDLELTGGFCNQGPAVLVTGLGADNSNGGGKLEALNVKFFNNIATDVGGAVSIESGGSAFVSNSVFYNNKANKGGAVYVGGSTKLPPLLPLPVISTPGALPPNPSASSRPAGCSFRSCTTFANTEFSRNQAGVSGGAIFVDDSSPECADVGGAQVDCTTCTFLNNTARHEGGALLLAFVSSGATANTKQSAFLSNIAGGDGGDVNIQAGQAGAPGAQLHAYSTAFSASSAAHGLSVAVGRAASATFSKCDFSSYIVGNSTLCEGTCNTTCPVDKGLQQLQGSCPDALPPAPLCPWIPQECPPPVESTLPLTPSSPPPQIVLPPSASPPPPPGAQIIPPPPPSPSNPPPPPPVILPPQPSPSIHPPPPSPTSNPPAPPLPPQLPSPSISPPAVSQAPPSIPPPASPPPTPPSPSLNPPPALPQTAPPPPIPTFLPPPPPIQPFPTPSPVSPPPPRQRRPRRPRQPRPPPFLGSPPPPTSAFPPPPPKKKWPSPPSGSQGTVENAPPAPPPPSPASTDFQSPPPPPKRRWAFPPPPNGQGSVENAPPAPPPPPATLAAPPPPPKKRWAFPPPQGQASVESAPPAPPPPPSSQGSVKGDPHFVGKHGERFDFHGKNGRDYCVVSDKNIHINMHVFHGKLRKSTFISKLGILYRGHRILIEAQINGKQNHTWKLAIDDVGLTDANSTLTRGGLTITRGPQFAHIFAPGEVDVLADIIHATFGKRGSLKDYLNLQVTQLRVSPDVHGLLGQTYKETTRTYEKLHAAKSKKHSRAAEVLVDGSESDYLTTDVLSPDCKFATFEAQATWPKRVKRTLLGTVQKLLFVASKDRLVRGCVGFGDQALCHA